MTHVHSECCSFNVGRIKDADAYCYVCGKVHRHGHLDLRDLRTVLLGKVVKRHNLDWTEIQKDLKKFSGMQNGVFCQSVMTEIEALCPHGKALSFKGHPLRLHMCYGVRPEEDETGGGEIVFVTDTSVKEGLDFTSDICDALDSVGVSHSPQQSDLAAEVENRASEFQVGSIVRYNPKRVAFEPA